MAVSLGLILWFGRGSGFSSDDLYYYARLVNHGIGVDQYDDLSLTYLLAPHNNHLQIAGRLVYEGLFATVGPHYFWYRLIEAIGILLCVGLFFELARTRIGPWPALAPSILLLFYGYAWEALLWPFDLHTVYALAAGLAALLCLERETRWTAPAACILLTLSVAMIELGLAFVIAVAVLLATRRRWSRPCRRWCIRPGTRGRGSFTSRHITPAIRSRSFARWERHRGRSSAHCWRSIRYPMAMQR